jgi:hypothetical protein
MAGLVRAWCTNRQLALPDLRAVWLVLLAFLPQWLVFFWSRTRTFVTDQTAAVVLVSSLGLLLIFAWANRRQRAFWWLGLGLLLNLLVILLNGGLMPMNPETLSQLRPSAQAPEDWQLGRWLSNSKDIVLLEEDTRLAWLSDRFLIPDWFPTRAAFSLGDVLISIGAFWLLWQAGSSSAATATSNRRFLTESSNLREEDVERS